MSVQFVKETIESGRPVHVAPQQTTVEAEMILPGGLRDEVRVMHAEADAVPVLCEASGGKVTVSGRVDFRALYAQGDLTRVKVAQARKDFSKPLTVNAGEARMQYQPFCEVTAVSCRVFNGRLLLQAELNVYVQATETQEIQVISRVEEADAQVLCEDVAVQRIVGEGRAQGLIREEFEVSDVLKANEALLAHAEARVEDIAGGADGKATVTGVISLTGYYSSSMDGKPVVYSQHSFPFEQAVTLSGEMGDMMSVSAEVTDTAVALEGEEDHWRLRAEVGLETRMQAIREQNVSVVTDAFSTGEKDVTPQGSPSSFCTQLVNEQTAESGRVQLLLPRDAPRIRTVLAAFAHPVMAGAKEQGGRLNVDMILTATLLYMTEDSGIPVSYTAEEPLRLSFLCGASADDMLLLTASHVEASMIAGDRAEVRCVITLHANGARYKTVHAVSDLARNENTVPLRGLALYITQPEERLWDVMKRYRLSETEIKALNEQAAEYAVQDVLPVSTRLIAYKR